MFKFPLLEHDAQSNARGGGGRMLKLQFERYIIFMRILKG